jgi:hypothetical protein
LDWHRASSEQGLDDLMIVVLAIALVGVMLAVSAVLFGALRMGSGK